MVQTAMSLPVLENKPWQWLPPVVMIAITVLAVNFAGDGLRDALDPRTTLH
jgi:peptide/nickel transport system permease protein